MLPRRKGATCVFFSVGTVEFAILLEKVIQIIATEFEKGFFNGTDCAAKLTGKDAELRR